MKNKLLKNSIKEIKDTFKRFVSILLMAFLGVGFFSGLVATGPDMQECIEKYYDKNKVYDISIISTMGLNEEDLTSIRNIEEIENAYGVNSIDEEIQIKGIDYTSKIIEIKDDINAITLIAGRMPENDNECVLDNLFAKTNKYVIGTKIKNGNSELEIVGLAQSPLYVSSTRGSTNLGTGTLNCFIYVNSIEQDYYTNIYIKAKKTSSTEYESLIKTIEQKIDDIKEDRQIYRYNEIKEKAIVKINEAKSDIETKKAEANSKITEAEEKLTSGQKELRKAKNELELSKMQLNEQKQEIEDKILSATNEINSKGQELRNFKTEIESANTGLQAIRNNISELQSNLELMQKEREQLINLGQSTVKIDAQISFINTNITKLKEQEEQITNQVEIGNIQIAEGEKELKSAKETLENSKKEANEQFTEAKKQIDSGEQKINENEEKLKDGKEELENQKKETNEKIFEAEEKIKKAETEINDIKMPSWYIQDRNDNSGYSTFTDSVSSMINVAKIFPIVFFIIAILTSSTSMTRMVEEERTEIGTLKALGYTNIQILAKYILYSFLASTIGGIIGMEIGFKFLPTIIWKIYGMLFNIPSFEAPFRIDIGLLGQGIAILCIVGATIVVCMKELKNMPATLMRPKAPKSGKRILLEKIKFIWKRLKFSQKVTTRNLLRYKKRGIMTIIGIVGCTSLVLAGFGLKDSITGIVPYQYGKIFTYKEMITINDENNLEDIEKIIDTKENIVEANMKTATYKNHSVNIITPKESVENVINLYESKTGNTIRLDDSGVIITEKLADLENIKVADIINIQDGKGNEHKLKVSNIVKNYVYNYIYISKNVYEENFEKYKTNMILVKDELSENQKKKLLDNENVLSLLDVDSLMERVDKMFISLNYVVMILIVSAALLAFVVLYNLANINIGERIRELATLKVLGFYNKEIDNYISKETNILTAIGIFIGLFGGYILCNFLISTCEIEMVRFIKHINPISYIYAIAITIVFTIIVNIIVHKTLKKIDMIESLKSIE